MTKCTPPADDRCRFSEDAAKSAVKQVFAIHSGGKVITAELTYLLNDLKGI